VTSIQTRSGGPAQLYIDGEFVDAASAGTFPVLDPATDELLADVQAAEAEDVERAIAAAREAQPAFAARPPRERGHLLMRVAEGIRERATELAETESRDTGKPLTQARADVAIAADYFEFYAGFADKIYGDTIPLSGDDLAFTLREPVGVTGHIIPWNYPMQISARTLGASLAAGNACVIKPAEEAPLTTLMLAEILQRAGAAPGLVNVLPGLGATAGAALAASDGIDHISFTGGVETGRLVMQAAARNLKPSTMELGGKSPSIVLDDADLARAVPVMVKALVQNCGQTCSAGSRLVVQRSRHDELMERLTEAVEDLCIGPGLEDPDVGPLISSRQRERVLGYLDVGREEGATLVTGGAAPERAGNFVQPTVFDGVTPRMRIANEEVFGPVLAVLTVDDDREALEVADSTEFGLISAVWTRDVDRAMWLARHLQSGQVYVNSYGAGGGVPLPFGGYKRSGFGREKGLEAIREFTQVKTVAVAVRPPEAP
jgi:aldehyde dehydrogenase (NAD+)